MKQIKAFIFDADGVLIKSDFYFSERFSEKFNVPYEKIMPFFENEFRECVVWKADLRIVMQPYLKDWNWQWTLDDILKFWFEHENTLDERIVKVIENLRSKWYKCYLATNQEKYRTEYMKKNMWINNIFDNVFVSCDIGHKKPSFEFYQNAYEKIIDDIDVRKDEIFFVDDSEENVEKAKEFWFKTLLYADFEGLEKIVGKIF